MPRVNDNCFNLFDIQSCGNIPVNEVIFFDMLIRFLSSKFGVNFKAKFLNHFVLDCDEIGDGETRVPALQEYVLHAFQKSACEPKVQDNLVSFIS